MASSNMANSFMADDTLDWMVSKDETSLMNDTQSSIRIRKDNTESPRTSRPKVLADNSLATSFDRQTDKELYDLWVGSENKRVE